MPSCPVTPANRRDWARLGCTDHGRENENRAVDVSSANLNFAGIRSIGKVHYPEIGRLVLRHPTAPNPFSASKQQPTSQSRAMMRDTAFIIRALVSTMRVRRLYPIRLSPAEPSQVCASISLPRFSGASDARFREAGETPKSAPHRMEAAIAGAEPSQEITLTLRFAWLRTLSGGSSLDILCLGSFAHAQGAPVPSP